MFRRFVNLLYGSTEAEFMSSVGLEESVQRLRSATSRWSLSALTRQRAVGRVKETGVSLQRAIPFVGNSFKPFFTGRFEERDGKVALVGQFRMLMFVRIFLSIWFGFAVVWTIMATASVIIHHSDPSLLLAGLAVVFCGLTILIFGKWLARNDIAWLSAVIQRALSNSIPDPH
jgi:hypothetical protein